MNPSAADIIAAARMAVCEKHPYLSAALFALRPHPAPGLGTLAVDEGWRLYYDPDTVTRWHNEEVEGRFKKIAGDTDWHHGVAAVVFHELGHVLRQHFARRGDRDPQCANDAMDREINDDVVEAGWKLPGAPLLPSGIGMADGLTFEEYYQLEKWKSSPTWDGIHRCISSGSGSDRAPGCGGACGGIAGNPTQWEKENKGVEAARSGFAPPGGGTSSTADPPPSGLLPDPVGALEQQIALKRTALDTIAHAKSRGLVPRGLRAWADLQLLPPKIDWRKKLAGLARQALASCAGAVDFTWRRQGRRSAYAAGQAGWPLSPALFQPLPQVCIVLDTSGSMSSKGKDNRSLLEEALAEVVGICRAAGGEVWGVACDAAVHALARIGSAADLVKLNKGGGGTSMVAGIKEAEKRRPDLIVVLTDGLTDIPEALPRARLLWGIIGDSPFTAPGAVVRIDG